MARITDETELRALFRAPSQGAVDKEVERLDDHCRAFIEQSPFFTLGTRHTDGTADVSPKGGPPGFVQVLDDHHLAYGELPGNNRLDSFANLLGDPAVGMIFFIGGLDETLRVNGVGEIRTDPDLVEQCALDGRRPKVVVVVEVRKAFIHCAKALRRSTLWDPTTWPAETDRPRAAEVLLAHTGMAEAGIEAEMVEAALEDDYANNTWND